MKKINFILVTIIVTFYAFGLKSQNKNNNSDPQKQAQKIKKENREVQNVILMIPDGTSIDMLALARLFKGGALSFDDYISAIITNQSTVSAITESAAAATALATGKETAKGFIGVLPDSLLNPNSWALSPNNSRDSKRPVINVFEAAHLSGRSTGLVVTSFIQDATPAAFTAHCPNRHNYELIARQQVYNNIDIAMGGGKHYLLPQNREDHEDLITALQKRRYGLYENYIEFKNFRGLKAWCLFADENMHYDIDRNKDIEPSLADMTQKAISTLSRNDKGFFLLVEGSKVDQACHANDPVGAVTEFIAFDKAVQVALTYALNEKDKKTVVIICPDHGTGGISIGNSFSNKNYASLNPSKIINQLKKARISANGLEDTLFNNPSDALVKDLILKNYNIDDLKDFEVKQLKENFQAKYDFKIGKITTKPSEINTVIGPIISRRAYIGWTTTGHTGEDVFLAIYNPDKEVLKGVVKNTEIADYIADLMKVNLDEYTKQYFAPAEEVFRNLKPEIKKAESSSPTFNYKINNLNISIESNKNIFFRDYNINLMNIISVYNGKQLFLSRDIYKEIEK